MLWQKKDSTFVNIVKIFFNGTKLYFLNFEKFFKYMAFPVFGQIVGISMIFFASYIFTPCFGINNKESYF